MIAIVVMTREGASHSLTVRPGASLMQVIRDQDLDETMGLCGGSCSCATCHVHIDAAFTDRLPPMSGSESALLDSLEHRGPTSRLACQVRCDETLAGLSLRIAPEE